MAYNIYNAHVFHIHSHLLLICIPCTKYISMYIIHVYTAKTETFGLSLMDIGVGTFIVSSALTSRYARGLTSKSKHSNNNENKSESESEIYNKNTLTSSSSLPSSSTNANNTTHTTHTQCISHTPMHISTSSTTDHTLNTIPSTLPSKIQHLYKKIFMSKHIPSIHNPSYIHNSTYIHHYSSYIQYILVLLLGLGRLIVLKLFNYHEHISEYGQHWNFFVTLFCIWVLVDIIHTICIRKYIVYIAISILFMYQVCLSKFGLTRYVFSAPRTDFISANRYACMCVRVYVYI